MQKHHKQQRIREKNSVILFKSELTEIQTISNPVGILNKNVLIWLYCSNWQQKSWTRGNYTVSKLTTKNLEVVLGINKQLTNNIFGPDIRYFLSFIIWGMRYIFSYFNNLKT